MPAGNGISYRAGGRRVGEAVEGKYPPCPWCGAREGDPCRTPNDNTTEPHGARRDLMQQERSDASS